MANLYEGRFLTIFEKEGLLSGPIFDTMATPGEVSEQYRGIEWAAHAFCRTAIEELEEATPAFSAAFNIAAGKNCELVWPSAGKLGIEYSTNKQKLELSAPGVTVGIYRTPDEKFYLAYSWIRIPNLITLLKSIKNEKTCIMRKDTLHMGEWPAGHMILLRSR